MHLSLVQTEKYLYPTIMIPEAESADWRTQLDPDSRHRVVNIILETLKRHLPFSGQEGLLDLKKVAVRFEEKTYIAATSQPEYLRKISLKMLAMEQKSQPPLGNALQTNPGTSNQNTAGSVSGGIQAQVHNQGQQISMPIMGLPQNIQNNMTSTVMQNSASLTTAAPSAGGDAPASIPNVNGQNSNLQSSMQNISNVAQNSMTNFLGQGMSSNMFANNQQQIPGSQQVVSQQSQNQHFPYQQQLQHQLNQKFPQGSNSQSLVQPHMQQQQQQQQQNVLQQSQHNLMQPTIVASPPLSNHQQNQQSSTQQSTQTMLPQQSQPIRQQQQHNQQTSMIHQQTLLAQQPILASQQQRQPQQQITGQLPSGTIIQQNQMISQPNSIDDIQQKPTQSQRMIGQQSNMCSLQHQQLLSEQGNLSNMHQQPISKQNNVDGLQETQIIGPQSNNSGMQSNQQNGHILQQSRVTAQQPLQQAVGLIQIQGQQPQQMQLPQQQLMSQIQSQPAQLQQQIGGFQANTVQRDMQQRLQTSSPLLHHQDMADPQKQMQRRIPNGPSTSLDSTAQTSSVHGGDWQEESYQKIRTMKEMYFVDLNELYQRLASKLELHDIPQQPKNGHLEKLQVLKAMLEMLLQFLRLNKNDIQIAHREKIVPCEKQIVNILNRNRPRKPVSSLPQGQLLQSRMHAMQQNPQSQSLMQPHESQMSSQMQSSMTVQGSVMPMRQNNLANLQHNSFPSASNMSNPPQNMVNSLQSGTGLDAMLQGNTQSSFQRVALGSIKQNPVNGSQHMNMNPLALQSGMNTLQSNLNPLQQNSNMVQHQQLKQEPQILQSQHLKQLQHQQLQQQILHRQQMLQQQQQQPAKQQKQPAQLPSHNMSQIHQMNEVSDLKMRQRAYHHPQLRSGTTQHLSPQIDQQNMPTSLPTAGMPLQSSSSPSIIPSPSTPLAPSPMQTETEKINTGVLPLAHPGPIGHQQDTVLSAPAQSLAVGTPGISASPLLAEFTSPDGTQCVGDGKSTSLEQPHERLMRAVKSISSKALTAAVSDISSVVSMFDRLAGPAPGNGSRAAVGEDLVAMTKCRLQARNLFTQEGPPISKKMRRYASAMPSNVVSSAGSVHDSFRQINCSDASELESTATSCVKLPLAEDQANHVLIEEMREINRWLIDTTMEMSNEDIDSSAIASSAEGGEGTIVKCSYNAVALSSNLKALYASAQMSPIQPLRLLVPNDYPYCSPILLDKYPVEVSGVYEDLSEKAKSKFSISLRSLSQPMSLADIAWTWDVCARAVITEYAQQLGGGTFSSKYGTWEDCLSAA